LVGDQLGIDELPAGGGKFERIDLQGPGHRRVGVVTEPVSVSDGDQEQVKSPRGEPAITEPMLTNESMIDPAELRRDLPQPIGTEEFFVCHTVAFG